MRLQVLYVFHLAENNFKMPIMTRKYLLFVTFYEPLYVPI